MRNDLKTSEKGVDSYFVTLLDIDRAYLSSHWVTQRDDKLQIFCKAWPVKNSGRFDKNSFFLDWDTHLISCPNQVSVSFEAGKTVHFPLSECAICPLREDCTSSKRGRSVSIHLDEALMQELRARQSTAIGRQDLRKRITVEHSLAHIAHWQGNRARYRATAEKSLRSTPSRCCPGSSCHCSNG